ncbi:MAG TPA: tyrosine-type recombinase/integrase [Bacteroidia bacterium]|nr:tyrosine-type recombinase/integrase [Bacteroidia bacterium]
MKHLAINQLHEKFVEEFNLTLKALGYNRGKDSMHPVLIREFLHFLEQAQIEDVRKCSKKEIAAFFVYINERPNQRKQVKKLSESHIAKFMYSIRKFFDFLIDTNEIESMPAPLSKFFWGKKTEREILTEEEITQLYSNCKSSRDRAVLALAYGCGLRRSEITSLKIRDIIFNRDLLIVRDGKNHKNRTIPMCESVKKDLRKYVKERFRKTRKDKIADIPLFYSESPQARVILGAALNERVKFLVEHTFPDNPRMRKISLHSLRASIAVHLIDRNAEITLVQRLLGHTSIDTTHLYAKRRRQRRNIQNMVWTAANTKTRRGYDN